MVTPRRALGAASALIALAAALPARAQTVPVAAARETAPVRHAGDSADDPAIWIHPADPALSLIVGDDKNGGLNVYDLEGRELQAIDGSKNLNNVDLRYHFPLAGTFSDGTAHARVDLVGVGNETDSSLSFYKVNPARRRLEPCGSIGGLGLVPYGSCMYRSPVSGRYFYFVNAKSGVIQQWELSDNGSGGVAGAKVRQFDVGTQVEGCVADDVLARLYVGEEQVGIWRYGAEPDADASRTAVDRTGPGGHLKTDVEGLAIYYGRDGAGYLIASSQGNDSFVVYERSGANAYVGTFTIVPGAVDGVSDTDGIDVTNAPLGPAFPKGLFVAQDGANTGPSANQNYKLVSWQSIASKFTPPLLLDPAWDPRSVGAPGR